MRLAYIAPTVSHLALSRDQQTFFEKNQSRLSQCINTHYGHVCSAQGMMAVTSKPRKWEIEMLLTPSAAVLNLCNVEARSEDVMHWRYLETDGSWLFSTLGDETLRISCPHEIYQTVSLNGIGVLRLANRGIRWTKSIIVMAHDTKRASQQYIYDPKLGLNITDLYPELVNNTTPIEFTRLKDMETPTWTGNKMPLKTLVNRMQEIGQHQRITDFTHTMLYGGISIQIITVFARSMCVLYQIKYRQTSPVPVTVAVSKNRSQDTPIEMSQFNERPQPTNTPLRKLRGPSRQVAVTN